MPALIRRVPNGVTVANYLEAGCRLLIFDERHSRRVLTSYSLDYNKTRTQLGLAKDAATTSRTAIWHHHHHTNLVRIASASTNPEHVDQHQLGASLVHERLAERDAPAELHSATVITTYRSHIKPPRLPCALPCMGYRAGGFLFRRASDPHPPPIASTTDKRHRMNGRAQKNSWNASSRGGHADVCRTRGTMQRVKLDLSSAVPQRKGARPMRRALRNRALRIG
jgi:hypothetical protein